jgi:hypothetical protein
MYLLAVELDSFDELPVSDRVTALRRYLDALAQANLAYLKRHPETPALYDWAPQYKIKPRPYVPGTGSATSPMGQQADIWQDIPSTMRRGTADCKDLAAWRVAELYMDGYTHIGFYIKVQQVEDLIVYHIQVEGYDKNGVFKREDPSKLLGMPTFVTQEQLQAILTG